MIKEIERSAFHKTPEEKLKTYVIKKEWQRNMRKWFGASWKKHNNYPFTLKD